MENFWQEIHRLDQQVTLFLNDLHCCITDPVMQFFSNIPVWIPLYVAVVVFLFIRLGWKKALVVTASLALTFGLCDQFSNLIKDTVGRLRPCHDGWMVDNGLRMLEGKGGMFGFFSAHAANAFGFAMCSLRGFRNDTRLKYRGYACGIFIWAALVSVSRISVGKHYLGDVIIGTMVGLAFGLAMSAAASWIIRKMESHSRD